MNEIGQIIDVCDMQLSYQIPHHDVLDMHAQKEIKLDGLTVAVVDVLVNRLNLGLIHHKLSELSDYVKTIFIFKGKDFDRSLKELFPEYYFNHRAGEPVWVVLDHTRIDTPGKEKYHHRCYALEDIVYPVWISRKDKRVSVSMAIDFKYGEIAIFTPRDNNNQDEFINRYYSRLNQADLWDENHR